MKTVHSITQVVCLIHFGKVLLTGHETSYTFVSVVNNEVIP